MFGGSLIAAGLGRSAGGGEAEEERGRQVRLIAEQRGIEGSGGRGGV